MATKRIGRDGRLIQIGGEERVPAQILELQDDIRTLSQGIHKVEFILDTGDLREFDSDQFDELPNFRKEIDALEERVEALSRDVQDDFAALGRRVAALEEAA
jgi:hypothetical protein